MLVELLEVIGLFTSIIQMYNCWYVLQSTGVGPLLEIAVWDKCL